MIMELDQHKYGI